MTERKIIKFTEEQKAMIGSDGLPFFVIRADHLIRWIDKDTALKAREKKQDPFLRPKWHGKR